VAGSPLRVVKKPESYCDERLSAGVDRGDGGKDLLDRMFDRSYLEEVLTHQGSSFGA
jgi:hypothetical protein